jgi:hypothetical protein
MGLDAETELLVRRALAYTLTGIPAAGHVIPAPLYCNDIAEFWGTLAQVLNTKDDIETSSIAAVWLYPLQFVDDTSVGGADSPQIDLTYEFYLFRQYGLEREDENDRPDLFNSELLKSHNLFVRAWLDIKSAFQGNRNIAGLDPAIFAKAKTTSIVQGEFIQNLDLCEFVPGIVGFTVKLQETVKILLTEC